MKIKNLDLLMESIRSHLKEYLEIHDTTFTSTHFQCPNRAVHNNNDTKESCAFFPNPDAFKCFQCEISGDIYTAAHYLEGKPLTGQGFITDNVLYLADLFGIKYEVEEYSPEEKKKEELYKSLEDACKVCNQVIKVDTEKTLKVREYVSKRQWEDLVDTFQFGYCNYDKLIELLKKKGHTEETLKEVGLIPSAESRGNQAKYLLDNRLLFPIKNHYGRTVGFASRALDENSNGQKYLNSRNTVLYNKTNVLFNLDKARLNSDIYVVEGYADVFTLYKYGIKNVVALCGLSFNEERYKILVKQGITKINFCLDGEEEIITNKGNIYIKDIKIGDSVLTHTGKFKKVIEIIKNPLYTNLYEIENKLNCKPIKITANHPILANEYPRFNRTTNHSLSTPNNYNPLKRSNNYDFKWEKVENLTLNHVLKIPYNTEIRGIKKISKKFKYNIKQGGKLFKITKRDNKGRIIKSTPIYTNSKFNTYSLLKDKDFWKIIGIFLADGHAQSHTGRVEFATNRKDTYTIKFIQDVLARHNLSIGSIYRSKNTNCNLLYIYHGGLCQFFRECYNNNNQKIIPEQLMWADKKYQKALIEGVFLGDGTIDKTENHRLINTSYNLMLSIQQMLFRCDIVSSIKISVRKNQYSYRNNKECYSLSICKSNWERLINNAKYKYRSRAGAWIKEGYVYTPIKKITKSIIKPKYVYNLEIEDNHSYVSMKLFTCHNCLDSDSAGKQALTRIIDKDIKGLQGINLFVKEIPSPYKDVDELLVKEGVEAFKAIKELSIFDWKLALLEKDVENEFLKNDAIKLIVLESDYTIKEKLCQKLAKVLDVSKEAVKKETEKHDILDKGRRLITSEDIQEEDKCFERVLSDWDRGVWNRQGNLLGLKADKFPLFVKKMDGIQNMFYILAGDTNLGKTTMLLNLAMDMLQSNENLFILFFSIDDSLGQLLPRIISLNTGVPINAIANPKFKIKLREDLSEEEKEKLLRLRGEEIERLKSISDRFAIKEESEAKRIEQLSKYIKIYKKLSEGKQLVVFIDNLHRLTSYKKAETRELFMMISDQLKYWKNQYDIPVIATAELRKTNTVKRPIGDDIKETKDLQFDADFVGLLYNDYYKNPNTTLKFVRNVNSEDAYGPIVELNVIKNKTSSFKSRLYYKFYPEISKFTECTENERQEYLEHGF